MELIELPEPVLTKKVMLRVNSVYAAKDKSAGVSIGEVVLFSKIPQHPFDVDFPPEPTPVKKVPSPSPPKIQTKARTPTQDQPEEIEPLAPASEEASCKAQYSPGRLIRSSALLHLLFSYLRTL
jgi:hypothetical protein